MKKSLFMFSSIFIVAGVINLIPQRSFAAEGLEANCTSVLDCAAKAEYFSNENDRLASIVSFGPFGLKSDKWMTYTEALDFCANNDSHLPSAKEMADYLESVGALIMSNVPSAEYRNHKSQAVLKLPGEKFVAVDDSVLEIHYKIEFSKIPSSLNFNDPQHPDQLSYFLSSVRSGLYSSEVLVKAENILPYRFSANYGFSRNYPSYEKASGVGQALCIPN
jgi:hypothetical protein